MNRIEKLRRQVDELDRDIALLLIQRARIVKRIGEAKESFPVHDPEREREILKNIKRYVPSELHEFIERLYGDLVRHFRALEAELVDEAGREPRRTPGPP